MHHWPCPFANNITYRLCTGVSKRYTFIKFAKATLYLFHHCFMYAIETYYYRSSNHSDVALSIHCTPLSNYLTVVYVCQDLFLANLILVFQLTHFLLFNLGVVMTKMNITNDCIQYNDDKANYDLAAHSQYLTLMGELWGVCWKYCGANDRAITGFCRTILYRHPKNAQYIPITSDKHRITMMKSLQRKRFDLLKGNHGHRWVPLRKGQ